MKHLATPQPMLIDAVREILQASGKPWVIENVPGAPLAKESDLFGQHGVVICGTMFGLRIYRHQIFETISPSIRLARAITQSCRSIHTAPMATPAHRPPAVRE